MALRIPNGAGVQFGKSFVAWMGKSFVVQTGMLLVAFMCFAGNADAQSLLKRAVEFYKKANEIDSLYVEPRKYSFKVQTGYTETQEELMMKTDNGQQLKYRSHISRSIGPAIGVECLAGSISFGLGKTQVSNYNGEMVDANKLEYSVNVYTPMLNLDFFYRKTGDDFQMVKCDMPFATKVGGMLPEAFSNTKGLTSVRRVGGNAFYVFNHKKFSYPAAMTSACVQKRSAGSALVGLGYSDCTIQTEFNDYLYATDYIFCALEELCREEGNIEGAEQIHAYRFNPSKSKLCSELRYRDLTLWGGYAYNWVPVKNMLVSLSATLGLGYKTQDATNKHDMMYEEGALEELGYTDEPVEMVDINSRMLDCNFVGRGSIQYNNGKWLVGTNMVFNYFGYHHGDRTLRSDNMFWKWRVYVGFRFGEKKKTKNRFKKQTDSSISLER